MTKFAVLAMVLLVPAFAANAAGTHHGKQAALKYHKRPVTSERNHGSTAADRAKDGQEAPAAPPVTRLPVPPDTFRA